MSDTQDKRIGRAVASLRGEMSQKSLAAAMTERGCKWSQTTVWTVEQGDRPLRLAEAEVLASLFKVPVAKLLDDDEAIQIREVVHELLMAERRVESASVEFLEARQQLSSLLLHRTDSGISTTEFDDLLRKDPGAIAGGVSSQWFKEFPE